MTSLLISLVKEHLNAGFPAARKYKSLRNLGQVRGARYHPCSTQFSRGTDNVPKERTESTPDRPPSGSSIPALQRTSLVTRAADVSATAAQTLNQHIQGAAGPPPETANPEFASHARKIRRNVHKVAAGPHRQ